MSWKTSTVLSDFYCYYLGRAEDGNGGGVVVGMKNRGKNLRRGTKPMSYIHRKGHYLLALFCFISVGGFCPNAQWGFRGCRETTVLSRESQEQLRSFKERERKRGWGVNWLRTKVTSKRERDWKKKRMKHPWHPRSDEYLEMEAVKNRPWWVPLWPQPWKVGLDLSWKLIWTWQPGRACCLLIHS